MNYDEFKKAALFNFECGFLNEEDPAERKPFMESDEADAIIRKYYERGATRDNAFAADDELASLFAEWMRNGR